MVNCTSASSVLCVTMKCMHSFKSNIVFVLLSIICKNTEKLANNSSSQMIFCLIMDRPDDNFLSETIDVFITATAETWGCPRIPIPSWQFSWTVFAGDASNGDTQFKLTLEGQPSLCSTANEPGADKATIVTTESPHLSSGVFFLLMLLCSVFHLWI